MLSSTVPDCFTFITPKVDMREHTLPVHLVNYRGDLIECRINVGGMIFHYPVFYYSKILTQAVESGRVKCFPVA